MKGRKAVACLLAVLISMQALPQNVMANIQNAIMGIEAIKVTSVLDTTESVKGELIPKVQVDFLPPEDNLMPIDELGNPLKEDAINKKRETHYDIIVKNVKVPSESSLKKDIKVESLKQVKGTYSIALESYFQKTLVSGSLYETSVIAKHKHLTYDKDGKPIVTDSPVYEAPKGYFITDFNIQANVDNGLEFTFEYIEGMSYKIFYNKGNISDVEAIKEVAITLTPDEAKKRLSKDGKRVVYKVENAVPGQVYSGYVIPIDFESSSIDFNDIYYNHKTPKIVQAIPNIPLMIDRIGQDKMRLSWNIKNASWVTVDNVLYQTVIKKIDEKGVETEIGRIYNENNGYKDVGYFECATPSEPTYYKVDFILKIGTALKYGFSAGPKLCIIDELKEVPYSPSIPAFFPYNEGDAFKPLLKPKFDKDLKEQTKFKVKRTETIRDDLELTPYTIDTFKKNTFHYDIEGNEIQLQLVWDIPLKIGSSEVDYDLFYDIWISEEAYEFNEGNRKVRDLKINEGSREAIIYKQDKITPVGFKKIVEGLKPNTNYYIKMVAKRKYENGEYVSSLPTFKEISTHQVEDNYNPPTIGRPPLQIKEVTQETMTLAWATSWYEIKAKQPDKYTSPIESQLAKLGSSRIYIDKGQTPSLRFYSEKPTLNAIDLYGKDTTQQLKSIFSTPTIKKENYITQCITLGDRTKYRIKVISEKEVENLLHEQTLEKWVQNISRKEMEAFKDISDELEITTLKGVEAKQIKIKEDYKGVPLQPNTPYVVLLAAYTEVDEEIIYSAFPGFLLETTLTDHISSPEVPKIPRLYHYKDKDIKDTEVTVRWKYEDTFNYELVYSRLEDPSKAEVWTFTEEDKSTFTNGGEAYVAISGLLPETSYNFWLRAIQKEENVEEGKEALSSEWSIPVVAITHPLKNPMPPSGLGIASRQSILKAGVDFDPKGHDYLTVEWTKNEKDDALDQKEYITYGYEIEFADNVTFLDAVKVMIDDTTTAGTVLKLDGGIEAQILAKNLVKFSGLESNMPYYIRVKTLLTFKESNRTLIKESIWTEYVRLFTTTSDDEYDGGNEDNIIIYDKPIEETYIGDVWTYHLVDTAKIKADIHNGNSYFYTLDMKLYRNRYNPSTRKIKIPKEIIETLIQEGMALQVHTYVATYEIPAKALKTYLVGYQAKDSVELSFTTKSYRDIYTILQSHATYIKGEQFGLVIEGDYKETVISKLDGLMKVKFLKALEGESLTYQYQEELNKWVHYKSISNEQDELTYSTAYTGLNALYNKNSILSGMTSSMQALNLKYSIIGLGTNYRKQDYVQASQFVTLMLGLSTNASQIELYKETTKDAYTKAKLSGLYISSSRGYITKEQALSGIVKLYEIKNGYPIKPSRLSFNKVSQTYQAAIKKAYAIGLIEDITFNPQDKVTYAQFCDWLVQIIE